MFHCSFQMCLVGSRIGIFILQSFTLVCITLSCIRGCVCRSGPRLGRDCRHLPKSWDSKAVTWWGGGATQGLDLDPGGDNVSIILDFLLSTTFQGIVRSLPG